jgi:predicted O-methyltransferase YrrM
VVDGDLVRKEAMMSDELQATWTEENSETYARLAAVAVPAREEQLATLLTLIPFGPNETFRAVELGSGQGYLSRALLTAFPRASVTALDGSEAMRRRTAERLSEFGLRARVEPFDLFETEWRRWLNSADVVLSSLVLHHLDEAGKQELFQTVADRITGRGALLIADLVAAQRPEANGLFGATLERMAELQSLAETGSSDLFALFKSEEWNYYFYPDEEVDRPSPLFHQLMWLFNAGFPIVDCFWMQAGHAVYGGFKARGRPDAAGLPYADALRIAETVLRGG